MKPILLTALAFLFIGCTANRSTYQRVWVTSDPANATVYVDDKRMGSTPCDFALPKRSGTQIKAVKQGYKPAVLKTNLTKDSAGYKDFFWSPAYAVLSKKSYVFEENKLHFDLERE